MALPAPGSGKLNERVLKLASSAVPLALGLMMLLRSDGLA